MRLLSPSACACLVALAGCGGGEDEPARTVNVAGGEPIRISADEYRFDPASIVVAGAAEPLRITLDNEGGLPHDVKVLDGERELGGTPVLSGGEEHTTRVRVPPGSYRLVCTVGDHEQLGMVGTLEVGG